MSARHLATAANPAKRAGAMLGKPLDRPRHRNGDQDWKLIHQGSFYAIYENANGDTRTEWSRPKADEL